MSWRVTALLALIIGKTIAGDKAVHPGEAAFAVLEILAVFAAGYHMAHGADHSSGHPTRHRAVAIGVIVLLFVLVAVSLFYQPVGGLVAPE